MDKSITGKPESPIPVKKFFWSKMQNSAFCTKRRKKTSRFVQASLLSSISMKSDSIEIASPFFLNLVRRGQIQRRRAALWPQHILKYKKGAAIPVFLRVSRIHKWILLIPLGASFQKYRVVEVREAGGWDQEGASSFHCLSSPRSHMQLTRGGETSSVPPADFQFFSLKSMCEVYLNL